MTKTYSIEDLAKAVNSALEGQPSTDDKRHSKLSIRRIRDYQSKKLLHAPTRSGKCAVYNETHFSSLMILRMHSMQGLTDSTISTYQSISTIALNCEADTHTPQQQNAMDVIGSLISNSHETSGLSLAACSGTTMFEKHDIPSTPIVSKLSKEYALNDAGNITLKFDSVTLGDIDEDALTKRFKQILKQENNND
jgi:DNA-binding transcriptional MerR regulator